ncbi:hypothetical protein GGR57DRAFT_1968 [Xylariaceae sp. FL1272]|nr:hypothetical protein GGR57DRAFT_1968 [Xylariaceae sp. FL1272]
MLISSALSACDSSQGPVTRLQSSLLASPPASPPSTANSAFGRLVNSCHALQSILSAPASVPATAPTTSASPPSEPMTPPMSCAPLPPIKMRLRSRRQDASSETIPRKKIAKRQYAPPRGHNKRRRPLDDDMGRDDGNDNDSDSEPDVAPPHSDGEEQEDLGDSAFRPSTPKRARIAPETIPLGLEPTDFHSIYNPLDEDQDKGTDVDIEPDGERWSVEDDRILVELVLDKLKLSKSDWQECARSLGKDRNSLGRRWKSLMVHGDIGLKSRARRNRIHGTWR